MKEDIKYPAILKSTDNSQTVVVYKDSSAYHIDGEFKGEYSKAYNTDDTIDAGREVLANTYGKVESKEHAEFIVELAELHGFKFVAKLNVKCKYFRINESYIGFYESKAKSSHGGVKQITIPMPPKEVVIGEKKSETYIPELNAVSSGFVVSSGEQLTYKVIGSSDFDNVLSTITPVKVEKQKAGELSSYLSPETPYGGPIGEGGCYALNQNTGDNKSARRVESNSDEWPKVGDLVQTNFGKGLVSLLPDIKGCYVISVNGNYLQLKLDELKKPKTPEEELRDEFAKDLDSIYLSSDVISVSPSCDDDFEAYANEMIKLGWVKSGKQ